MATWKVSVERIELFPHPNAESLEIAKVGMFQLVVNKANGYKTGDLVVFAPKRSLLPEALSTAYTNTETGKSYLVGIDHDRVSSIRLRGELSEGVTIAVGYVTDRLGLMNLDEIPLEHDISAQLGISLYEPPLPVGFGGDVSRLDLGGYVTHDVESMAIYGAEFAAGEPVYATEEATRQPVRRRGR